MTITVKQAPTPLVAPDSDGTDVKITAHNNALDVHQVGANTAWDVSQIIPGPYDYETVAASQTDQVLGNTGAVGDFIHELWAIPASTSPGAVSIKDGGGSAITVFAGGASSIADLKPFKLAAPSNTRSTTGAWSVTTGANISVIATGIFTP